MTGGKIQKSASSAPVNSKQGGSKGMADYVKAMMPAIKKALPSVITPERFSRITMTALQNNPQLQQCTPVSFMGAMMQAAQLGLEPNTVLGQAYLIPFRNKGRLDCQFQLGYKGLIDLAYRSGQISTIQAHVVYERDDFEFEYGLDPVLKHIPTKDAEKGNPIFFYAIFKTKDGGYGFEVMSVSDIRKHAEHYSKSYDSKYSPWNNSFEEMAKKTVLKRVLKYAPLKTEFLRELNTDETVKSLHADAVSDDFNIIEMPNEVDYEVDQETGEITEPENDQQKEPSKAPKDGQQKII